MGRGQSIDILKSQILLHPSVSSLSIRAEHEIYIGNYPVKFKESDVRKLFEDHQVTVGAIRMKHDGLKV